MQKIVIDLDGVQSLVDLTPEEIAELEALAVPVKSVRTVDKRRLRLALHRLGLLDSLVAAVDSAGVEAIMQWEDATNFSEDSELVQSLIAGLGWDAATVDSIFELATTLS